MLQRSPTYYMVRPNIDPIGSFLRRFMGKTVSYFVMRWKNIQLQSWFFKRARKDPKLIKDFLIGVVKENLIQNTMWISISHLLIIHGSNVCALFQMVIYLMPLMRVKHQLSQIKLTHLHLMELNSNQVKN